MLGAGCCFWAGKARGWDVGGGRRCVVQGSTPQPLTSWLHSLAPRVGLGGWAGRLGRSVEPGGWAGRLSRAVEPGGWAGRLGRAVEPGG
jgi:hypothetical protein